MIQYLLGKRSYLGPTQVKCQLLDYDIFLNELMTFSWKCHKLSSDINENISQIHSNLYHNLKVNISLEVGLSVITDHVP